MLSERTTASSTSLRSAPYRELVPSLSEQPPQAGVRREPDVGRREAIGARLRHLRRVALATAIAGLGIFSGLAATQAPGTHAAASAAVVAVDGSSSSPAGTGYFDPYDSSSVGSGSSSAVPDATSQAS
jgi:hypothetical protein